MSIVVAEHPTIVCGKRLRVDVRQTVVEHNPASPISKDKLFQLAATQFRRYPRVWRRVSLNFTYHRPTPTRCDIFCHNCIDVK
jgi:hypothetical protein